MRSEPTFVCTWICLLISIHLRYIFQMYIGHMHYVSEREISHQKQYITVEFLMRYVWDPLRGTRLSRDQHLHIKWISLKVWYWMQSTQWETIKHRNCFQIISNVWFVYTECDTREYKKKHLNYKHFPSQMTQEIEWRKLYLELLNNSWFLIWRRNTICFHFWKHFQKRLDLIFRSNENGCNVDTLLL